MTTHYRQGFSCILLRTIAARCLGVAIAFLLLAMLAKAGHVSGVDLTYECLNNCTTRVSFRGYRNCGSTVPSISPFNTFSIAAAPGCVLPSPLTGWVQVSVTEVTPVCPGTPTLCNTTNAPIAGIEEHFWVRDYDFCQSNCTEYILEWRSCCRNGNITTLNNPASTAIYVSTTFNPALSPCNSSPQFTDPPVAYICQNQSYVYNQGAVDPDGDSLAYRLGPCMRNDSTPVNYNAFSSDSIPLGIGWWVTTDSLTGDLVVSPDTSPFAGIPSVGVICIYVEEWRNGQLINTVARDMQITVVPCPNNSPPTLNGFSYVAGGIARDDTIFTCLGATVCADMRVMDPDLGQMQAIWWDTSLAPLGATFTAAGNPQISDTITGTLPTARFCWAPSVPGTYSFDVVVRDSACPIYGSNQYTFTVQVGEIATLAQDSISGCDSVVLCALPLSGIPPFTYQWNGTGGINLNPNNTDSCFNHQYPYSGAYPYTLVVQDSLGCTATFNDTLIIPNNVQANAGPDDSTCSNQAIIIGPAPQATPNLLYTWTPSTNLNNNLQPQPTATISNNSSGPVFQNFILELRDTMTKCLDRDTMRLTVFPIPSSPFFAPPQVCQGSPVGVAYTGSNAPTATYNWTFVQGTPPIASGQGPHQISWSIAGLHELTLTVTENGCTSPLQRDTIEVIPIPIAQIAPVADQCLINNSFSFQNQGSYGNNATFQWTFSPTASPSISTAENPSGIVFSSAGTKTAILRIFENGCASNTDTIRFNVTPDPNPNWSVTGGIQCFNNNSYQFQATGNNGPSATYQWSFQNGTPATSTNTSETVYFSSPGFQIVSLTVSENGCTSMRTDTIFIAPEPVVIAGPNNDFCEGEGGAQIFAIAGGGSPPYAFTWSCGNSPCGIDSLNDDDPFVNPTSTTWYYVQVTDAYGCQSAPDSVLVTVVPKPQVDAGPDVAICGNNAPCSVLTPTVTGGSGNYNYQWIPGAGLNDSTILNPCARPDSTTIYALVVTDLSSGCSSDFNTLDTVSTVKVTVHPEPLADAGEDISICPGDSVQLEGIGSGAGPDYQYQWSPTTGLSNPFVATPFAFPSQTTTYSLVTFSNGCASEADSITVFVRTIPSVDAGGDREICLGESVLLNATAGGDSTAVYSFSWSANPLGNLNDLTIEDPTASPQRTSTYYVTAISSWGCASARDSVTIFLRPTPIAEAGDPLYVCIGDSVQLQGSYYYGLTDSVVDPSQIWYSWSPKSQMNDSSIIQPMILPDQSGWYNLSVQHADCITSDSVFVTVIPELNGQASADTNRICAGDSVQLYGLGGLGGPNCTWYPGTGLSDPQDCNPRAAPTVSTTYMLILNEAGCADTARVAIEVLPTPEASYVNSTPSGCAPLEVQFSETSSDGIFHIWDFGDGSPVVNQQEVWHRYTRPGSYPVRLTVVGPGACADVTTETTVEVFGPPEVDFASTPEVPATLTLPNAEVDFRDLSVGASQWRWDFADGTQSLEQHPRHVFTETGNFLVRLIVTSPEGCRAEISKGPYLVLAPDLFIPNVFSPNADGTNDRFLVEYSGDQPVLIEIRDRWGVLMYQSRNKLKGWNGQNLRGAASPEGVYYYNVRVAGKSYTGVVTLVR